jgi:maleate isomerase
MFGWRKRIGYISPGTIDHATYDFYSVAPEGVGLVALSNEIADWRQEEYDRARENVLAAARYLASRKVHFVHHAGAPPVASQGPNYMHQLKRELEEASGLPASTAMYSATQALRSLEVAKLIVLTPFPTKTHEQVVAAMAAQGFDIVAEKRMDANFKDLYLISQREAYDWVTTALRSAPRADGAYIPCPQWHVFELARYIEGDTGIPTVTSNSGDFWYEFTTLGITGVKPGYGVLLDRLVGSRVAVGEGLA